MSVNTSYTIQMASKISGVGVHTIRAWEKRYKALEPNRDSSGHRTYTKIDVEKLMLLSELCLLGYTISKVAKLSIPDLKLLLKDLGKSDESMENPEFNLVKEKPELDAGQSINILLFALRSYKLDVLNQEIGKLKSVISARDMALDIILPLATELTALCARGVFNRTQEEAVVALLRFHAGVALFRQSERKDQGLINIAILGIESDSSDLHLIMAGLLCNHYGFNSCYLGQNISIDALIETTGFLGSSLIVLTTGNAQRNASYIQSYVEKLMQKSSASTDILLSSHLESSVGLNLEKFPARRFGVSKSIEALDQYLASKRK